MPAFRVTCHAGRNIHYSYCFHCSIFHATMLYIQYMVIALLVTSEYAVYLVPRPLQWKVCCCWVNCTKTYAVIPPCLAVEKTCGYCFNLLCLPGPQVTMLWRQRLVDTVSVYVICMLCTRPPGHHAMEAEACGYCFVNNTALAAKHAVEVHNLKR